MNSILKEKERKGKNRKDVAGAGAGGYSWFDTQFMIYQNQNSLKSKFELKLVFRGVD